MRYNPNFLQDLSYLVAISVVAVLSISLQTNGHQRIEWMSYIVDNLDASVSFSLTWSSSLLIIEKDVDVREVGPKILEIIISRLESRYMEIAEANGLDPILKEIPPVKRKIQQVLSLLPQAQSQDQGGASTA